MADDRTPAEEQLRALFDQASDGLFVADIEGHYTDVNEAGCRMLGYSREEILRKRIVDLLPPEDVPRLWASRDALLGGGVQVAEWRLRHKDGRFVPVEVSAKILPDGRWQGLVRDIGERKRGEAALAASEAKFRAIVHLAADAIISIQDDQRIVLFNPAAERIFGWSASEMLGQPLDALMPERYREPHREHVRGFAASASNARPMSHVPIRALRRNGEEFPAEASLSQVVIGDRRLMTVVLQDVSERERLLEQERFLAEVGAILAASLDLEVTLCQIGALAVRRLADYCVVDLVRGEEIRRWRVFARDERGAHLASRLGRVALDRTAPHLLYEALQSREPHLVARVTPEWLDAHSQGPEHLALLRALDPCSVMQLPLVARGRLVGALGVLSSGRRYDERDLRLGVELARRAALAIENANLLQAAEHANVALRDTIADLEAAQRKIRGLEELLPVCAWCGRVRDGDESRGEWKSLERYLADHEGPEISHGICPDCHARLEAGEEPEPQPPK